MCGTDDLAELASAKTSLGSSRVLAQRPATWELAGRLLLDLPTRTEQL
jgi:hypothetical protein